jgi:hypothetical protein
VALALVHYPVIDRAKSVVTTAITNLDLHDIARSAHTFGLRDYFVVHPIAAQRELAERVRVHWTEGSGARRIPDRSPAMQRIRIVESLDQAMLSLGKPELWVTSAEPRGRSLNFPEARGRLSGDGPPVLLVFGTGWGLADEVHDRADFQLDPIRSPRDDGYNHLSVRAAVAIILDRLFSRNLGG